MKKSFVVLVLLLLAFSLAGCKEDVSEKKTTSRPSGSPASAGESEAAGEEGSAEASAEQASEGGDWADKFTNLVSMKKGLEFSVTYDYSMSGSGSSDSYTMTQYFAKNKYRMDSATGGKEGRFYLINGKMTTCTKDGAWQCMTMPQGEQQQSDPSQQFSSLEDDPGKYDTTYKGTRSIAGTTAYCYEVKWAAYGTDGGIEACYSKEGVPLYMKTENGGVKIEMKATKYSTSLSASDFEFPAEPQDLSAMMAQYGR
ncbi:MAG: hypothetical protein KKD17_05645 [Nanoarchaeota archaeon]|nr:hypothetical protein [Nanoarchaeota archaeon]